jgi:hypothetical protein
MTTHPSSTTLERKLPERTTYGLACYDGDPHPFPLGFVAEVDRAPAGNVILRVGKEHAPNSRSWSQVAHLSLTPAEARALAADLLVVAGG